VYQVTFSEQSLEVLNSLPQSDQLSLMDKLGNFSSDILKEKNDSVSKFFRKDKAFFRIRLGELRIYFEQVDIALHCHYILPKNSLNDFLFRCKLPSSDSAVLENHGSFWEYLESLSKNKQ